MSSCSANQKAQKSVESGNYDQAFDIGFQELTKDKNNQKILKTFKQAYEKANERDLRQIELYKNQNNPVNLKKIYALYEALDARQYQVITLQPLQLEGQELDFNIKDYSTDIATAKKNYSQYLYNAANEKMKGTKPDARDAYKLYGDLEYINPTFVSNLTDLITKAKAKGSSFVLFKLDNKIAASTPKEELDELMRISEVNMTNPWVIYHDIKVKNTPYDYEINIILTHLNITPQQMNSELVPQQARIKDGWEYIYDTNGNVKKDSLGNDMKRDKIITVQAEVKIMQQAKSAQIDGTISVKNLKTNATTNSSPIIGEAKFENVFAIYRGDQRAIEQKYYEMLQKKEVPYPIDAEFVKYGLGDFKAKMMQFINSQSL